MGTGLVLQGGGMRGLFTTGVLDCFLKHGIKIDNIYGVSAGSLNALSYITEQPRRNLRVNMRFCSDSRYIDPRRFISGDVFDLNFVFNELPTDIIAPLDYNAFKNSNQKLTVVATDCMSGESAYFEVRDLERDVIKVMASCALPMFVNPIMVKDRLYVDGGATDPIPLKFSMMQGNRKNVVIMTRKEGYRKTSSGRISAKVGQLRYRDFPKFRKLGAMQTEIYNSSAEFVEEQQLQGNAFVIYPKEIRTKRYDTEPLNILAAYMHGYKVARELIPDIKAFLEE